MRYGTPALISSQEVVSHATQNFEPGRSIKSERGSKGKPGLPAKHAAAQLGALDSLQD